MPHPTCHCGEYETCSKCLDLDRPRDPVSARSRKGTMDRERRAKLLVLAEIGPPGHRRAVSELLDALDAREAELAEVRARLAAVATALTTALSELGVPGPGYPAPVANAVDILRAVVPKPPGER